MKWLKRFFTKAEIREVSFHTGNTDEHTAGCLLVGDNQFSNLVKEDGFVGVSVNAYKRIYPPIAEALEKGEEVKQEIKNL